MGLSALVTGGAGFIGAALSRRLLADGWDVRVLDDFHRGQRPDLRGAHIEHGDILNPIDAVLAARDVDVVIHCAAIAGVGTVVAQPYKVLETNLIGTYRVLESACHAKRVVFFSTSEVYGPMAYKPTEDGPTAQGAPTAPRWVYSTSKLAGEHLVIGWAREHGRDWTVVRPFNVYGPGQLGEGAVERFANAALTDAPLIIHGDGSAIRSWCYVDDAVEAVRLALGEAGANQVFNVGNPRATCSTLALAEHILDITSSRSELRFEPLAYPEIDVRVPNIDKARRLLGWEPQVGLWDGLGRTVAAYHNARLP